MDRSLDALAKSLADEISRRESLRRVGGLLRRWRARRTSVSVRAGPRSSGADRVRPSSTSDVVALVGPDTLRISGKHLLRR